MGVENRFGNSKYKVRVFGPTAKKFRQLGNRLEDLTGTQVNQIKNPINLSPQEQILDKEDDMAMLMKNERFYSDALTQDQSYLRFYRVIRSWGITDEDIQSMMPVGEETGADVINKAADIWLRVVANDRKRAPIVNQLMGPLVRAKVAYRDEVDKLMEEHPEIFEGISPIDKLEEKARNKQETLMLIRLQLGYLRDKNKAEKKEKKKQDKLQGKKGNSPLVVSVNKAVVDIESGEDAIETQTQAHEEVKQDEPFGLSKWKVYWTDARFSTNPNQLVEMPTGTRDEFFSAMDEINAGRKQFQIKSSSVASCIEMWDIQEFRARAQGSKFRYGPEILRDWAKIVRGGVRIMIKADEEAKRIVFFASDRDAVYARGIASW